MKTKKLTFLLALTFLFLFSGSVYGGVFDKKEESVVFTCQTKYDLFSVDMNEKTITRYSLRGNVLYNYKIIEENEIRVKGKGEGVGEHSEIILHKYSYKGLGVKKDKEVIELFDLKNDGEIPRKLCFIGDKKF
jgi:hypothetical protein